MSNKKVYICNAYCPELKEDVVYCTKIVESESDMLSMLDSECPCGNTPNWILNKETVNGIPLKDYK